MVKILLMVGAYIPAFHLTGNHQQRYPVLGGVGHTVNQVGRSGPDVAIHTPGLPVNLP